MMAHFYAQTESGVEPRHYVPMAKDPTRTRPTRISDYKKWVAAGEIVAPSVTTILSILDKPGLNNWRVDRHLDAAFEYPSHELTLDEYRWEIKRITQEMLDQAPKAGTDFHTEMEFYILGKMPSDHPRHELCANVLAEIQEFTGARPAQVEVNFISPMGFAGQADLVIDDWVIDYKTKETADKFKPGKMAYDEHAMQLAAYGEGLGIYQPKAANVFVCLETGEVDFHEHTQEQLDRGWQMFCHCLELWKLAKGVK